MAGTAKNPEAGVKGKSKQGKKKDKREVSKVVMDPGPDRKPGLNKTKAPPSSPEQSKARKVKASDQAAESAKKSQGRPAKADPQLASPRRDGRDPDGSPEAETSRANAGAVDPSDQPKEPVKPAVAARRKSKGQKRVNLKKKGQAGSVSL